MLPNAASQRLHESFGFVKVGAYERVGWKFNRWHDVGYWQLHLRNVERPHLLQAARMGCGCLGAVRGGRLTHFS